MISPFKLLLTASFGTLAFAIAAPAAAQSETAAPQSDETITSANDIVVQGQIGFRNRSEETEPKLVYGTDYFQRFEPLTAGDALKRVPSVTFLSDVIESDGARLRGLDPGYTQILINGDKVPGSNTDRSFFLDRIPAELISQVEIVRSSSARRTGDAVAGTLNIVLRDGYQLDGGYIRAGGLRFRNDKIVPSVGAVYGGALGPGRILLGANVQGRYNPKLKKSLRYGDSPENNPNYATDDFDDREEQIDTRDGMDYAFNATYGIESEKTDVQISAFYVRNDRKETERSYTYDHPTNVSGSVRGAPAGNLLSDNANVNKIDQDNYSFAGKLKQDWSLGKTTLKLGYARFIDRQHETEYEIEFDRAAPRFTGDLTNTRVSDKEFSVSLDHEIAIGENADIVIGGFAQNKDRDTNIRAATRQRFNLANTVHGWNQFSSNPTEFVTPFTTFINEPGSNNRIDEDRRDIFALVEGKSGIVAWEAGLRYETTRMRINDRTVAPGLADRRIDYEILLPSASLKLDVTASDRVTLSAARTNRRPRLDYVSPALLLAELGDNDLLGNPNLRPETAWGADAGYEHRIGSTGVIGINFFFRDVTDLVEMSSTGAVGSEGPGTVVLQPRNTGNGQVYGIEFDLSSDLRFIGMKNTGVFGNFSYLESDIDDAFGARRFNGQSRYVFNLGFIQNLPSFGGAFGATYRKQGGAFDRIESEEVSTNYGGDLEIFIEKRFGNSLTIRAVGSNLLDSRKDEVFNKFATIGDQRARDFDEYEIESERAGPVFQLMARLAF
ncbi:MAG: TonB-dependent receptor [Sphingomonadales bacterium]|nr:MAG: TonB-dependent receptor [Sphingomonadales bacterium]